MLAAPQFFKNLKNQSTQGKSQVDVPRMIWFECNYSGMSIFMVLGWLGGDLFKVIYFYVLRKT